MEPLTNEQIKNWRNALAFSIGPWACMMPAHEIELIAVRFQQYIDADDKYTRQRAAEDARTTEENARRNARRTAKQDETNKRLATLADRVASALEVCND